MSLVHSQIGPFRVLQLARHQFVELERERAQPRIAGRVFLVEPPDQDHIGNAGDVAAPVAALRLAPQRLVALEDRLDVLRRVRNDDLLIAIEQQLGAHQAISVTDSFAVGVVPPTRMPAIFWPGVTVKYSTQSVGSTESAATAVGVPSPMRTRTDVGVPVISATETRIWKVSAPKAVDAAVVLDKGTSCAAPRRDDRCITSPPPDEGKEMPLHGARRTGGRERNDIVLIHVIAACGHGGEQGARAAGSDSRPTARDRIAVDGDRDRGGAADRAILNDTGLQNLAAKRHTGIGDDWRAADAGRERIDLHLVQGTIFRKRHDSSPGKKTGRHLRRPGWIEQDPVAPLRG